jgi:HEAT repeat protein
VSAPDKHLIAALTSSDASMRLRAVLAIGSNPEPDMLELLVAQCAIEPDFYVRDMLTWALTRFPSEITAPRLVAELSSQGTQARSQALHSLSKIRDPGSWPAITRSLLRDPDDEVARSAWRAAVVLVPEDQKTSLAEELAAQFGRGDKKLQLSLSRALVALGEEAVETVLQEAMTSDNEVIHAHARATERLLRDPNAAFELDVQEAKRIFVLSKQR